MPPKENKKKEKQVAKYTYNWCKHHMACTVHKPVDCELEKKHKDNRKKRHNKANSAIITSTTTTAINPCYAALLAALGNLDEDK